MFSIQYKTRVSLGVPGIILNAAEPFPDFFQELSTVLPHLAQLKKIEFLYDRKVIINRCFIHPV